MHPDLSSQYIFDFRRGAGPRALGGAASRQVRGRRRRERYRRRRVQRDRTARARRPAGRRTAFPGDLWPSARRFSRRPRRSRRSAGASTRWSTTPRILRYEKVDDVTEETFEKMVNVGLKAAVWGTQALLAHYDQARGGAIINMASPVAYRGYPTTSIYSSIKGAIVALTHTLAAELGPRNVRVNAVAPGFGADARRASIRGCSGVRTPRADDPAASAGRGSGQRQCHRVSAEPRGFVHQRNRAARGWRSRRVDVSSGRLSRSRLPRRPASR